MKKAYQQKVLAFGVLAMLMFFGWGCNKVDQSELDQQRIDQYLIDNNLMAMSTSSGLHYIIEEEGVGGSPTPNNLITVYYEGQLLDGTVFDGRRRPDNPLELFLGQTIQGWQQGIPLIQKGGKIKLLIPSALGYGERANGAIPSNSVLVFDVELVDWE